jgi:hypothetical protein
MMNNFYVYNHVRLDTNEIFYVGKGKGRRAYQKTGRNSHWRNIVNKVGFKVNILVSNLLDKDALEIERLFQISYEKEGINLCNKCECGLPGNTGHKFSEEQKKQRSKISKELWSDEKNKKAFTEKMLRGLNNPSTDKNIYEFYHKDYGIIKSTRFELGEKYNLLSGDLGRMIKEKTLSIKGWRLFKNKDINSLKDLGYNKRQYIDNTLFYFYHDDYKEEICRIIDLSKKYNIARSTVYSLAHGIYKKSHGWRIKEVVNYG